MAHIKLFEQFMGDSPESAGMAQDYTQGVICIADYGGGGLAVGTINQKQDAAYIQELEQYVPKDKVYGNKPDQQIGIDVFPGMGDTSEFVCFSDGSFNIYKIGDNFQVPDDSYVFTIPNGKFLVLTDGYGQYELLTAEETRDWFAR